MFLKGEKNEQVLETFQRKITGITGQRNFRFVSNAETSGSTNYYAETETEITRMTQKWLEISIENKIAFNDS